MSPPREPMTRLLLLVFAGVGSVAMLIAAIALLIWVRRPPDQAQPTAPANNAAAVAPASDVNKPTLPTGKRFTLRLGQGFRFKDGVVVARPDDQPDVTFKY